MSTSLDDTTPLGAEVRALRDHQAVVDALYRFGAGLDLEDEHLFLSAFSADATFDFTQPARRLGADVPVTEGRSAIAGIMQLLAPLDTTHTVTNPRVTLHGDRADLFALVEAQHVTKAEPSRRLLLKNIYEVELVRDGPRWVAERMVVRNVWFDGDPGALFDVD